MSNIDAGQYDASAYTAPPANDDTSTGSADTGGTSSDTSIGPGDSGNPSADSVNPPARGDTAPPAVTAGLSSAFSPPRPVAQDYIWPTPRPGAQWGQHDYWSDLAARAPSPISGPFLPQPHQQNRVYGNALGFLGSVGSGAVAPFAGNALRYGIAYQQGLIKGQIARAQYEAQLFASNAQRAEYAQQKELQFHRDAKVRLPADWEADGWRRAVRAIGGVSQTRQSVWPSTADGSRSHRSFKPAEFRTLWETFRIALEAGESTRGG